jgi:CheY-like chemotaxis protein
MTVKMANVWTLPGPDGPRPGVCLEVLDEGQGIEPRDMERIFNPYFTTKGQGSGLGLTIAHSIVTHHGGMIEAESEPRRGTVVRVTLPAAEKSTDTVRYSSLPQLQASMRVLVLDDEKDVLILTEQMLMHLGMSCVGVVEGREAVETFAGALGQNRPFSVFIADLTVPGGVGGVEALARIRELDPTVTAIVISGYSNDPVLANYEQYGFDAVLRKPFELETFAAGLVEALERGASRKN